MKAGNIKKGQYIKHKNKPFLVTDTEFSFYGRGLAHMKLKLKSIDGLSTESVTYKSNDNIEELDVSSQEMQFLYLDQDSVVLMDPRSYEQVQIPISLLEGKEKMLAAEIKMYVQTFEGKPVGVNLPPKVKLKVTKAPNATAGNRAKAAKKDVTLETGLVVQAPLFIKEGDQMIIDTQNGNYVSRA
jgi:elongation factor P